MFSSQTRWRRVSSVLSYWVEGQFVVENYRAGVVRTANPNTARVLDLFSDWRSLDEVCKDLPEYSPVSIRRGVRQLARERFLVEEGSRQAEDDERFAECWSSWQPHAAILHFGTKDMPFANSDEAITRQLRSYLKESPQPAFLRSSSWKLHSKTLPLPNVPLTKSSFVKVLLQRRTHRDFSAEPLELENLSTLLCYTWGTTGFIQTELLGPLPLKTSPSAGARHPCEVYVFARRVTELTPGLYHYAADKHCLRRISSRAVCGRASQYCGGQEWVERAAALFLITAVFPRSMWKYRFPRAYRTVLADAAHLCQTFCLVATYLRLAPFCTMALKDSLIEQDLGIDGVSEAVLYVAGVGLPTNRYST
jgi:SagB-type dehydrogenase family enzyme